MQLPQIKVGVLSVGYPNFRFDIAKNYLDDTLRLLEGIEGINLLIEPEVKIYEKDIEDALDRIFLQKPDLLILELGTYTYGSALMACLERLSDCEFMLWAFREPVIPDYPGLPLNSLCALNMFTSFLHRMGKKNFSYFYNGPDESDILLKLSQRIMAIRIKKGLKQAKFCIVGGRVPGFYLSNVDELRFRNEIGPEIIYYSLAALISDSENQDYADVETVMNQLRELLQVYCGKANALEKTARMILSIRKFAVSQNITGFALKCWPDLQELYQVAPCAATAILNQQGILVSCEGDVTGLATMYMQQCISKKPVFLTDLVNITPEGIIKLWHCGSASPSLASKGSKVLFGEHPTMKQGIGIGGSFYLEEGEILVAKLSEGQPYRMLLARGRCQLPDRELTGNQGDIKIYGDGDTLLEQIISEGIEHHFSMAYDADIDILKELCRILEIRCI